MRKKTMFQVLVYILRLMVLLFLTVPSCQASDCITWNYHDYTLTVSCKVLRLDSNVAFLHFQRVYGSCIFTKNSIPRCSSDEGSTIVQNTTTNETLLIIKDVINKQIDGQWSCVYKNNSISTEVSLLTGLSKTVIVNLRGEFVETNDLYNITLQCASCWDPLDNSVEFLVDGYSVDNIQYNHGKCYHKEGECDQTMCACTNYSNGYIWRTRISKSAFKLMKFSCLMRFRDIFEYNIFSKYSFLEFTGTGFRHIEPTTTVESTTHAEKSTEYTHVETFINVKSSISVISGIAATLSLCCICACVFVYTSYNTFKYRRAKQQEFKMAVTNMAEEFEMTVPNMEEEFEMTVLNMEEDDHMIKITDSSIPLLYLDESRIQTPLYEADDSTINTAQTPLYGKDDSTINTAQTPLYGKDDSTINTAQPPLYGKENRKTTVKRQNMYEIKDRENWFRLSVVIKDEVKKLFICLLESYLRKQGKFGITLPRFLFNNKHIIIHLYEKGSKCCLCDASPLKYKPRYKVLRKSQMDILLVPPTTTPFSGCTKYCCYDVNLNLQSKHLDISLLSVLLINCTDIALQGTAGRKALDYLRHKRKYLARARKELMSDDEFERSMKEMEMKMMYLATVCGEDKDMKQSLVNVLQKTLTTYMGNNLQDMFQKQKEAPRSFQFPKLIDSNC